jgi:hypothetical protein
LKKLGFEKAFQKGPENIKLMVSDIRTNFPGKKIWMTEWNLGQSILIKAFNSLYHAIFNMRMIASILEADIELNCYHVLAGRGWELIGPDRFTLDYNQKNPEKLIRRATYFPFKLFGNAYKNAESYKMKKNDQPVYICFKSINKVTVLGWTITKGQYSFSPKAAKRFKFFQGVELSSADLLANNGSLPYWNKDKNIPWEENLVLKKAKKPEFQGPGIFSFTFNCIEENI